MAFLDPIINNENATNDLINAINTKQNSKEILLKIDKWIESFSDFQKNFGKGTKLYWTEKQVKGSGFADPLDVSEKKEYGKFIVRTFEKGFELQEKLEVLKIKIRNKVEINKDLEELVKSSFLRGGGLLLSYKKLLTSTINAQSIWKGLIKARREGRI